jgi:hypothetical protein
MTHVSTDLRAECLSGGRGRTYTSNGSRAERLSGGRRRIYPSTGLRAKSISRGRKLTCSFTADFGDEIISRGFVAPLLARPEPV